MSYLSNLLVESGNVPTELAPLYFALCIAIAAIILVLSILSIIFVLMQPSTSDGINSITGSSETFFGKNKGKSIEAKLKKWTVICLVVIGVLSIVFFILQYSGIWVHS